MWSKSQRRKNQCKAWFLVPITILKYECWVSACVFPLLCQQEQFIGNCEHSEADRMSLAHKPHSKAPSPLWLLYRNTEKSTVGIGLETGKYHFLMVSFPVAWIPLVMILGAVQVVSAAEGPHTSKGTCSEDGEGHCLCGQHNVQKRDVHVLENSSLDKWPCCLLSQRAFAKYKYTVIFQWLVRKEKALWCP